MAASSFQLGKDAKLYQNTGSYGSPTWTERGFVRSASLAIECSEGDVTTRGNGGWKAVAPALREGTIELTTLWAPADTGFQAMLDAFNAGTLTIEYAIMDSIMTTSGAEGLRFTGVVLSMTRDEPIEDAETATWTLKPTLATNAPSWHTSS